MTMSPDFDFCALLLVHRVQVEPSVEISTENNSLLVTFERSESSPDTFCRQLYKQGTMRFLDFPLEFDDDVELLLV